jgi:hypothetical protein
MRGTQKTSAELHRITCPYCVTGYAEVLVDRPGGKGVELDLNEPRHCEQCRKFFKLRVKVQFVGVMLPEEGRH